MKNITIITGASKGIGQALAQNLLEKGHTVIGTSRSGNIKEIDNSNFIPMSLDLTDPDSISQFVAKVKEQKLHPILLINNAGVGPDLNTEQPSLGTFDDTFNINVRGTVFLTEDLLYIMPTGSRIMNVSSIMGSIEKCNSHGSVAYRMSKSALNMYSKILANKLEGQIDVAMIHPGWVRTNITPSTLLNGSLSPQESASNIVSYLENNFKNGEYWDTERGRVLQW